MIKYVSNIWYLIMLYRNTNLYQYFSYILFMETDEDIEKLKVEHEKEEEKQREKLEEEEE